MGIFEYVFWSPPKYQKSASFKEIWLTVSLELTTVKDFSRIEFRRHVLELFEKRGHVKNSNGFLEFLGIKKLPPGQPAQLEAIIRDRASQLALEPIQQGIILLKSRVHFDKEALDPQWGIRID